VYTTTPPSDAKHERDWVEEPSVLDAFAVAVAEPTHGVELDLAAFAAPDPQLANATPRGPRNGWTTVHRRR